MSIGSSDFEKTILVTGGAGFIGTNFVDYFAARHRGIRLIDLDALTYAAHPESFDRQAAMPNVVPVQGDICDAALLAEIFEKYDVSGVIHFAAESHVDNSIADPVKFVRTNVMGTAALLDAAKRHWDKTSRLASARFHHISTDEVFGTLGAEGLFTEDSPYAPTSPYSASKASADLLVEAYAKTFGLNTTISHCSNNFGPWQHAEKFIPTVIRKCLAHELIPIYGTGLNIRDWLWVEDHCSAIETIFLHARAGSRYVVSAQCERTNLELARTICALLDRLRPWAGHNYAELIDFVTDRPGHDFRYASSAARIRDELGWLPTGSFEAMLERTLDWYLGREVAFNQPKSR